MLKKGCLVINADDLGLSRAATEGVVRAHLEGVVTSASLVATTGDFHHAVDALIAARGALEAGSLATFGQPAAAGESEA